MSGTVVVLAKSPRPGRSKTRLCPPLTTEEAAALARAALLDTMDAVTWLRGVERILAIDGDPTGWSRPGWRMVPQWGTGLDERISAAFAALRGPVVLVGMDTPQVSPKLLARALDALAEPGVDAVLGPANDGGYWAVGLARPETHRLTSLFHEVPMSTAHTFADQWARFVSLGLRVSRLPALTDVDVFDDVLAVANEAPGSHFARAVRALTFARPMAATS